MLTANSQFRPLNPPRFSQYYAGWPVVLRHNTGMVVTFQGRRGIWSAASRSCVASWIELSAEEFSAWVGSGRELRKNISANPLVEECSDATGDGKHAIYFSSAEGMLFGWLHRPAAEKALDVGLVICNAFGYEAICSHRSVRVFAEAAADIGIASLRFDYLGTGDSADIDAKVDQIDVWSRDVAAAVAELRRRTGVLRVCLVGFRFGALLAALAARRCSNVCGLMAIAPLVNGRRYLKELRTLRLAALLGSKPREASQTPGAPAADRGDDRSAPLEVSGFALSQATLAALSTVDLCQLGELQALNVLLIDSERLPTARAWADSLQQAGVTYQYRALPGVVEMLMTAPQFAVVPLNMITAMREWLSSFAPRRLTSTEQRTGASASALTVPAVDAPEPGVLTERPLRFGADGALFGIVCEPIQGERRRRGVVLLNPGVDHHIGASRLYVSFARQWSARGYVVLRMDLGGIGDSDTRAGKQNDDVFPASALGDIRSALDFLRNNYQVGDISLVGLCSGAYHALRAAAAGMDVHRIIMINPQNYFWKEGMSLNDVQLVEVVRNPGLYRKQLLSVAAWTRLINGEVNLSRIVKIYLHRVRLAGTSVVRFLSRRLHVRLTDDLGRDLEEIAGRGIAILFVFARGEPGLDLLKLEGGPSLDRLGSSCRVHVLERGDHVFSHHDSRAALEAVLGDELFKKTTLTAAGVRIHEYAHPAR